MHVIFFFYVSIDVFRVNSALISSFIQLCLSFPPPFFSSFPSRFFPSSFLPYLPPAFYPFPLPSFILSLPPPFPTLSPYLPPSSYPFPPYFTLSSHPFFFPYFPPSSYPFPPPSFTLLLLSLSTIPSTSPSLFLPLSPVFLVSSLSLSSSHCS